MSRFTLGACQRRRFGAGKGALYRETLQATGFYVGRIVIATAKFAPMPPLHFFRATPAVLFRRPSGCVLGGITESIHPMWGSLETQTRAGHRLPPMSRLEPENASGGSRSRPSS